ncbi:MAG: hypothetical protein PWQ96_1191 [Clostridia bacterium]|nr:methicillin resistance protein [Clostridiales bacterium]MDK2985549.1 hypothetical protein [Clostridia bacterium]
MWKSRLLFEGEKEIFNNFIATCAKGHILQSWEWGEVKRRTGWQPFRLVVENDAGDIVAAISLLKREMPFLKRAIFYAPRGPVLDIKNEELFSFLMKEVEKVARDEKVAFLKIDPDIPIENTEFRNLLQKQGFVSEGSGKNFEGIQPNFVMRLDITPSEEDLLKSFHSKTRYNIRLAKKRGVEIKEDCERSDLKPFYEILKITAERDKFLIRSYPYFETLWEELVEKRLAKLFMAYYKGQPISGTMAFIMGDKAWYIYGASDNEHRKHMPNYLLQWHMILWAKSQGCTMYDFRGVSGDLSPENPLYGLYRFKKGFNPELVEFVGEYNYIYSPFYYRFWKTAEPIYGKTVRKALALKKKITGKK